MIGKSEILNILSCERVFIAVENWMARCSSGFISPQMLCLVFLIFVSKMNRKMQGKLDKYNIFNFNAHVAESWL